MTSTRSDAKEPDQGRRMRHPAPQWSRDMSAMHTPSREEGPCRRTRHGRRRGAGQRRCRPLVGPALHDPGALDLAGRRGRRRGSGPRPPPTLLRRLFYDASRTIRNVISERFGWYYLLLVAMVVLVCLFFLVVVDRLVAVRGRLHRAHLAGPLDPAVPAEGHPHSDRLQLHLVRDFRDPLNLGTDQRRRPRLAADRERAVRHARPAPPSRGPCRSCRCCSSSRSS